MISIVLPTYNGEKYLRQSIDSILKQSYEDWELIIVDDCSTDHSSDIAKEYSEKDSRIMVIHNETNVKLPASLNVGFGYAKGEYYTWTSDDNVYKEDALEKLYMEMAKDQSIDFVYSNQTIIDGEDYVLFDMKAIEGDIIYVKNTIGACFLYKKIIHEKLNGYNIDKFLVEDYDFWLRAYRQFKFKHIDESLYFYRIHGVSLSAQRKKSVQLAAAGLMEENYRYIPKESKTIRNQVLANIIKYYSTNKKYSKAIKYYLIKKLRG